MIGLLFVLAQLASASWYEVEVYERHQDESGCPPPPFLPTPICHHLSAPALLMLTTEQQLTDVWTVGPAPGSALMMRARVCTAAGCGAWTVECP